MCCTDSQQRARSFRSANPDAYSGLIGGAAVQYKILHNIYVVLDVSSWLVIEPKSLLPPIIQDLFDLLAVLLGMPAKIGMVYWCD